MEYIFVRIVQPSLHVFLKLKKSMLSLKLLILETKNNTQIWRLRKQDSTFKGMYISWYNDWHCLWFKIAFLIFLRFCNDFWFPVPDRVQKMHFFNILRDFKMKNAALLRPLLKGTFMQSIKSQIYDCFNTNKKHLIFRIHNYSSF